VSHSYEATVPSKSVELPASNVSGVFSRSGDGAVIFATGATSSTCRGTSVSAVLPCRSVTRRCTV
jgi:hypothetical protein